MMEVTDEHLKKYFSITQEALKKVRIIAPKKTHLHKAAEDFLDMAQRYVEDAKFFQKQDKVKAYGALNYAHGWLDAGARLGLFDVDHDNRLFTVD